MGDSDQPFTREDLDAARDLLRSNEQHRCAPHAQWHAERGIAYPCDACRRLTPETLASWLAANRGADLAREKARADAASSGAVTMKAMAEQAWNERDTALVERNKLKAALEEAAFALDTAASLIQWSNVRSGTKAARDAAEAARNAART